MMNLPIIRILEGKQYEWGNHLWISHRRIFIEFDSDYCIESKRCNAKNFMKVLTRLANKIPKTVNLKWFIENENFIVPPELIRIYNNYWR